MALPLTLLVKISDKTTQVTGARVIAYTEAAQFNYPVLVGEQDAMAIAESSGVEFVGLPFTMFVASDGELLSAYIGELHQSHLDEIVKIMTRLDRAEISKHEARTALDGF